ncbi:Uncharacterised protein [Mycobacterium tuberculosis]|nr:Uncharacterised protein [Mycobacterium tuberculosis]
MLPDVRTWQRSLRGWRRWSTRAMMAHSDRDHRKADWGLRLPRLPRFLRLVPTACLTRVNIE